MLAEYKAFLCRGTLLDLAVAFLLGVAFNAVVQSFANDIIMAAVAGLIGLDSLQAMRIGPVLIGNFLATLLSFVIIATVLFMLIKAASRFVRPAVDETAAPETDEVLILREIRDELRASRS